MKVLNIEPSSYTPLVILFVYCLSLTDNLLFMLKFGNETKDRISPLFTFISKAPPPVALKVLIAWFNSLLIIY